MTAIATDVRVINGENNELVLCCYGDWFNTSIGTVEQQLQQALSEISKTTVNWQFEKLTDIDSAGMMLIIHHRQRLEAAGCTVRFLNQDSQFDQLYQLLSLYILPKTVKKKTRRLQFVSFFNSIGQSTIALLLDIRAFLSFLGESSLAFLYAIRHPMSIRYDAIVKNVEETGLRALPIIALTSLLIGIVITYQGAVQLEKFGANIFVVDMIGISMTRELAPLITAIVVAGRTGSAFTAQLGVMHITEEIPAMRTMGFDPQQYLVLPRITALIITLPLLVVFADILGLLAGMFISNIHLNLSYGEFAHRLQSVLDLRHVIIGLIKAPVFAWLIAVVACFRGFQVARNTESIGRYTTLSVVNAVFLVIACDALFSVVLTELKL